MGNLQMASQLRPAKAKFLFSHPPMTATIPVTPLKTVRQEWPGVETMQTQKESSEIVGAFDLGKGSIGDLPLVVAVEAIDVARSSDNETQTVVGPVYAPGSRERRSVSPMSCAQRGRNIRRR